MPRLSILAGCSAAALAAACSTGPDTTAPGPDAPGQFTALGPDRAGEFRVPSDMKVVDERDMPDRGRTYARYQQMIGDAEVISGQVTIHRDRQGQNILVLGQHFDDVEVAGSIRLTAEHAEEIAAGRVAGLTNHSTRLMLDPATGRHLYRVDSSGDELRHVHWIDAESGAVIDDYNALTSTCNSTPGGVGFDGSQIDLADLYNGSALNSGRQVTRDLGSWKKPFYGTADQDGDGCYDTSGRSSPGQGALVSAHAYVHMTDDYYRARGFDLASYIGGTLTVWAHYGVNYVNAYWDGSKMVFGDGDGVNYRELTGMDVAAHELTHGVTEHTSNLEYRSESGALNEAFSDIMAVNVGFSVGIDADWKIGDDSDLDGSGFRDMSDPALFGDYDHYCERYTGTSDNGGVHWNSGIANHAYYLLVNGGQNARDGDPAHSHASGPSVAAIPMTDAADIFYDGFTGLTQFATLLDARAATIAAASDPAYPASHATSVADAWTAVGVGPEITCGSSEPTGCSSAADCADDGDSCTDAVCNGDGTCSHADNGSCGGGGECVPSDGSCTNNAECCSGKCRTNGKKGNTCT